MDARWQKETKKKKEGQWGQLGEPVLDDALVREANPGEPHGQGRSKHRPKWPCSDVFV